ncbi:MAG: DUF4065 domain-containing protein [Candidatus Spechtbacteria bacterium SB0662_bin_43]|uniref:DUF4065 domain-containing protein n=1 Tax=Candidatus Spechtbacteria bacterium SB0662_bin_43 TaxID=2604897 RepID=A0A845DAZ7_9BACT|nr:DUF4065 domain-containing protein [Candidatus Spechtbacteria bacterium SB0662_bin_43]
MSNYQKKVQALNFFAIQAEKEGKVLRKTNALKLIYFADKKHLRESTIRTITGDSYKAKQYGPVARDTIDLIETIALDREGEVDVSNIKYAKDFLDIHYDDSAQKRDGASQSIRISSKKKVDDKVLSQSDIAALRAVWDAFHTFLTDDTSDDRLWQETHKYPEGAKFDDSQTWEDIKIQELISTTKSGENDLLGDVQEEDLDEVRSLYHQRQAAWGVFE